MDLELTIHLPSDQLSTGTLRAILRDATRTFERAVEDSIASGFRNVSRARVQGAVRGRLTYYIQDFRRNSPFEVVLLGAAGAVLATAATLFAKASYDLGIDLVKSSAPYERLKRRVRGELSTSTAESVEDSFNDLRRLGAHRIERVTIDEWRRPDGVEGRRVELWLADRESAAGYQDSAAQIDAVFRDLEGSDSSEDDV